MQALVESIAALTRNIFSVEEDVKTAYSFSDLSITQMNYLETIAKLDNPSVSELATALRLTKSTVSINLDKLIEKEYIRKVQSDKDKRVTYLYLTTKGEQVNELHDEVHRQIALSFSEKLNPTELEILSILFDKLTR
jgi:DNA-binding MarR family transcriptional regulator